MKENITIGEEQITKEIIELYKKVANLYPKENHGFMDINIKLSVDKNWFLNVSELFDSVLLEGPLDTIEERQEKLTNHVSICLSNFISLGIKHAKDNF